jgi:hypothetical protein
MAPGTVDDRCAASGFHPHVSVSSHITESGDVPRMRPKSRRFNYRPDLVKISASRGLTLVSLQPCDCLTALAMSLAPAAAGGLASQVTHWKSTGGTVKRVGYKHLCYLQTRDLFPLKTRLPCIRPSLPPRSRHLRRQTASVAIYKPFSNYTSFSFSSSSRHNFWSKAASSVGPIRSSKLRALT